jgi:drug/metabolite transporter (DMT)-like permease
VFALPVSRTLIATWAIYAYFIVALAQTLNFYALKRVTATNATVVYSLEIVFTIIWGCVLPASVIQRVALKPSLVLGVVLVLIGSLTEIFDIGGKRSQAEKCQLEGAK